MSDDWQRGDHALCVSRDEEALFSAGWQPKLGGLYTVADVISPDMMLNGEARGAGLNFEEDTHKWAWTFSAFYARNFRKVTPEKADEFDREVIEQMKSAPVAELV